jgi:tetratricopeptide (TPR) repeat protein
MNADIDGLTQRIENNPTNAWLYWERGRLYCGERRYKLAIEDFSKAIDLEPDEPAFWRSRGQIYEHWGHVSLSRRDMDRVVELAPEDAGSYAARGWNHRLNHDDDDALADFDRAIALDPLAPEYRCRRGLVWLEKHELGKALDDFGEAIRLGPEEGRYFYERARALLYRNPDVVPEQALPDLEAAIRLRPDADWYRMDRGYIRFCQRHWAEAAEDFSHQDFRHQNSIWPYLGAWRVVWVDLARRFEGKPDLGQAALSEYLEWYRNESACHSRDQTQAEKLEAWPVPLARFLAGEIDELQLLGGKALEATDPELDSWELDEARDHMRECHFVLAEWSRAQGLSDQAAPHLWQARGLPARNPMNWVATRRLGGFPEGFVRAC